MMKHLFLFILTGMTFFQLFFYKKNINHIHRNLSLHNYYLKQAVNNNRKGSITVE